MPNTSFIFIDELPVASIERNWVKTIARSEGTEFRRVFPLEVWRAFIETEAIRLLEHDRAQGERVVPFKPKRRH